MTSWYSRSVFFSSEVADALAFYVERLKFDEVWRHEEQGAPIVAQVNRGDCEIILAADAARAGSGRIFIELSQHEVSTLCKEIADRSLESKEAWWGSPIIEILDPDGNELFFSYDDRDGS